MSVSGVYQYVATTNAPKGVSLVPGTVLTKASVKQLFAMKGGAAGGGPPTALNLDGCSFEDDGAVEAFATEVSKSLTLTEISFRGCSGFNPRIFIPSLQENVSLQKLDLSHCSINAEMMTEIAANVVPWSRTVIDWNFADNDAIGDQGAVAFVQSLAQTMSSTQRFSLRNCNIQNSMLTILQLCAQLPSLVQFDASLNAEIGSDGCAKALSDLDDLLQRNGKMILRQATHISLSTMATVPPPISAAAAALAVASPQPAQPAKASTSETLTEVLPPKSAAPSHPSHPPHANAAQARAAAERKGSFKGSSTIQRGGHPSTLVTPQAPPPAAASSSRDDSNHPHNASTTTGGDGAIMSPAARQPSAENGGGGKLQRASTPRANSPAGKSPARRSGSALRESTPSRRPTQASGSPSRARILDVQDGAEEWKRIKETYNQYIHMPGTKPKPIVLTEPKFVLGKRIDKIKERPSSAFLASPGSTRERQPTPEERRKLAPWADPNNKEKAYVGAEEVIVLQNGKDKVRIVNGGDVTFIENDPRDIGYVARKIQQKEMLVRTTGAFASNTTRDMRWGTDSSTELVRQAQAPGPGAYVVESELERNIRKWQQQRQDTSTGKKRFGATGSVRKVFEPEVSDVPGPGAYEIP